MTGVFLHCNVGKTQHPILALVAPAPGEVIRPRRLIAGRLRQPGRLTAGEVTGLKIGGGTVQAPRLVITRTLADREYALTERNGSWEGSTTRSRS
jgi:hypothetical protein